LVGQALGQVLRVVQGQLPERAAEAAKGGQALLQHARGDLPARFGGQQVSQGRMAQRRGQEPQLPEEK
jgi:hypothetical protein